MVASPRLSKVLNKIYLQAKSKNALFSQRAFAKKLQISPGALSEILNGRRKISIKLAAHFAERLCLDPESKNELLRAAAYGNLPIEGIDDESYVRVEKDTFAVISDWYHFGILSLLNTYDFQNNPAWIASRLGITQKQSSEALERLLRVGLLERSDDNRLKRTQKRIKTTDDVANIALRKFHLQDLELLKESLENDPMDQRDYTSITMAISKRNISKAKTLIRRFQDEISELLERDSRDEVYRLSVGLYPLSRRKG